MAGVSHRREKGSSQLPAWLLGLIIAAVIFVIVLIVFSALGYGDDPVLDPDALGLRLLTG